MSTTLEHLEQRVDGIETELRSVRLLVEEAHREAGEARTAAAWTDRDVAEFSEKLTAGLLYSSRVGFALRRSRPVIAGTLRTR